MRFAFEHMQSADGARSGCGCRPRAGQPDRGSTPPAVSPAATVGLPAARGRIAIAYQGPSRQRRGGLRALRRRSRRRAAAITSPDRLHAAGSPRGGAAARGEGATPSAIERLLAPLAPMRRS
jgi:pyruvate dehydrogenase E1 component